MIRRDNDAMGAFCCASVTSGYMGNDQDGNEWNCRGSAPICTAAACGRFHSSRGGSPSQQRLRSAIVKPSLVVFRLVVARIPYIVDLLPNTNPRLNNTLPLTIFYLLIFMMSSGQTEHQILRTEDRVISKQDKSDMSCPVLSSDLINTPIASCEKVKFVEIRSTEHSLSSSLSMTTNSFDRCKSRSDLWNRCLIQTRNGY
ncbi:hypothetical protein BLNAU_9019 [Blattamonas nauphoetae]|uniref:Uncharacterized protein n=1 Tax=Blattamonas nauphoetae TaxID=2049346 RepID=A0ABQ9XX31_9EUKA|nr:hypothetical protein BLNAU_9019 [Blattamonas nauphoetae]